MRIVCIADVPTTVATEASARILGASGIVGASIIGASLTDGPAIPEASVVIETPTISEAPKILAVASVATSLYLNEDEREQGWSKFGDQGSSTGTSTTSGFDGNAHAAC